MKRAALVVLLLTVLSAGARERAVSRGTRVDETLRRFHDIELNVPFTTPSFWAWELQLAVIRNDEPLARALARELYALQEPDGSWALGTDWIRGEFDFKHRLADDAESWEVGEVANALLDYAAVYADAEAVVRAARAAEYLKRNVEYVDGKPYLAHMPECNHSLQPHSTVVAGFLLSRLPGYEELGAELKVAGVSMNWFRIITYRDLQKLEPPLAGAEINDYEKIQIGWYLLRMGDPYGQQILDRYQQGSDINASRGARYLVLVYLKLGDPEKARYFAALQKNFQPTNRGYEYALMDIIAYALR
jgi:hypothetical protein